MREPSRAYLFPSCILAVQGIFEVHLGHTGYLSYDGSEPMSRLLMRCLGRQTVWQRFAFGQIYASRRCQPPSAEAARRSYAFSCTTGRQCLLLQVLVRCYFGKLCIELCLYTQATNGYRRVSPIMLTGAERQLRVRHILVHQDQEDLLNEIEAQLRGAQQSCTCTAVTFKCKLVLCAGSDCNWWHVYPTCCVFKLVLLLTFRTINLRHCYCSKTWLIITQRERA